MYNKNIWLDLESNPGPMQLKSGALSTDSNELSRPIYTVHIALNTSKCSHFQSIL